MSLSAKTLDAVQSAGAAVFEADAQLKAAAKDYAEQVQLAMLQNPFDLANDSLFEEWKSVCRVSQALGQIEADLRKIYAAASNLPSLTLPLRQTHALAAPVGAETSPLEVVREVDATDVVIKKPAPKSIAKARVASALPSNAAVMLAHLVKVLNAGSFHKLNQSSIATATGLPKGSIGASLIKLAKEGYLVRDPARGFKLAAPKA